MVKVTFTVGKDELIEFAEKHFHGVIPDRILCRLTKRGDYNE